MKGAYEGSVAYKEGDLSKQIAHVSEWYMYMYMCMSACVGTCLHIHTLGHHTLTLPP